MLNINETYLNGATYFVHDPNHTYICIGYGQNPEDGTNYVIGMDTDAKQTVIRSHLLRDVVFVNPMPSPAPSAI